MIQRKRFVQAVWVRRVREITVKLHVKGSVPKVVVKAVTRVVLKLVRRVVIRVVHRLYLNRPQLLGL